MGIRARESGDSTLYVMSENVKAAVRLLNMCAVPVLVAVFGIAQAVSAQAAQAACCQGVVMNGKKMLFLAVVLAALAALYFISEQTAAKKERKTELPLAAGFDASRAAAITITAPGKAAVALKKHGDAWKLTAGDTTYGADTAAVTSLLEQIGKMKSATVVSRNPKNFESFDVSDEKAVDVKIEDAGQKVSAHVLLGKNGPDIFSTYVRAKDAGTVYLVPGILKNMADRELKDWRDKKIWKLNGDRIAQYTVAGDKNLQLRKDAAGSWQAVCDGRAFAAGKECR